MTKKTHAIARLSLAVLASTLCGVAGAATLVGDPADQTIAVGDSTTLNIVLELGDTEVASVFQGFFTLDGLDSIASLGLSDVGGDSWPNAESNIIGDELRLSLTSNNEGGDRLLVTLDVTGLSAGVFSLILKNPNNPAFTFAAFDIDTFPFVEDLVLDNFDGQTLGVVRVSAIPVPLASLLFASALGLLPAFRRRKAQ